MNWINKFGFVVVILMLVPNIIYFYRNKGAENKCTNRAMNILEQIGRYGSMFLMSFNVGVFEYGFRSDDSFVIWLIGTGILLFLYWMFWVFYSKIPELPLAIALAVLPSLIFIISGFLFRHWLLIIFGVLFAVGHIYVSYQNNAE